MRCYFTGRGTLYNWQYGKVQPLSPPFYAFQLLLRIHIQPKFNKIKLNSSFQDPIWTNPGKFQFPRPPFGEACSVPKPLVSDFRVAHPYFFPFEWPYVYYISQHRQEEWLCVCYVKLKQHCGIKACNVLWGSDSNMTQSFGNYKK